MPLTHVSLIKGSKTAAQKSVILDEIYRAMRETFDVPEDDKFMRITEHAPEDLVFGRHYMGIRRSDDLIIIQLTVSDTRTTEKKKALFARIAEKLVQKAGVRPEDVFINLVETKAENWSFGNGIAQYAERQPAAV
ncbi:tautomerase family protein [Roseibium salinum]|uniref:Tautomerase family protein n=1 Tax=Roseibium salinum TaxID=1604349 RepID=A0ABT3R4Y6_9HYPH|nr:tautomerase family protein [Roseibium sp. DSM 29163]MCX2724201.1 tautomerase family protein [Roseibium sp. DSM 29163]